MLKRVVHLIKKLRECRSIVQYSLSPQRVYYTGETIAF